MQTWALTKIEFCMWTAARPVILNFWTLPTLKNPVWTRASAGVDSSPDAARADVDGRIHTRAVRLAASAVPLSELGSQRVGT